MTLLRSGHYPSFLTLHSQKHVKALDIGGALVTGKTKERFSSFQVHLKQYFAP